MTDLKRFGSPSLDAPWWTCLLLFALPPSFWNSEHDNCVLDSTIANLSLLRRCPVSLRIVHFFSLLCGLVCCQHGLIRMGLLNFKVANCLAKLVKQLMLASLILQLPTTFYNSRELKEILCCCCWFSPMSSFNAWEFSFVLTSPQVFVHTQMVWSQQVGFILLYCVYFIEWVLVTTYPAHSIDSYSNPIPVVKMVVLHLSGCHEPSQLPLGMPRCLGVADTENRQVAYNEHRLSFSVSTYTIKWCQTWF